MTFPTPPHDVPGLLAAMVASDPGRPRVTWYGPDGRVELSARVLENWVAKTANLLVEELDAEPGTAVLVDLPMHWRTVVWTLATWAVGGRLVNRQDRRGRDAPDVVVTSDSGYAAGDARLVLVALPSLDRSVGDLPPGALDYNAEVSGFPDTFLAESPTPLPEAPTLVDGARVAVEEPAWDPERAAVMPFVADGSVVLVHSDLVGQLTRIAADELVTDVWRPD